MQLLTDKTELTMLTLQQVETGGGGAGGGGEGGGVTPVKHVSVTYFMCCALPAATSRSRHRHDIKSTWDHLVHQSPETFTEGRVMRSSPLL